VAFAGAAAEAAEAAAADPEDAAAAAAAAALDAVDADKQLEGLPWEFTITKDARQEWAAMTPVHRQAVQTSHCIGKSFDPKSRLPQPSRSYTVCNVSLLAEPCPPGRLPWALFFRIEQCSRPVLPVYRVGRW